MRIDNLKSFCIYSVIGTISILPLLVLPAMIGILVDQSALSESFAGWSASVNFSGGAVIAIVMAFRMHHLDLRKTATLALAIAALADVASGFTPQQATWFLAARFVAGIGAGAAYTAAVASFARFKNVDSGYGIFITLQFIVSGIGLYVLPVYSASVGVSGMFLLIAAMDVLALMLARYLPGKAIDSWVGPTPRSEFKVLLAAATLFGLLGFGLFEAANTAQFTYVERLGVSFMYSDQQVGIALLIASLIGIPGAFSIIFLGNRFGRTGPLAFGIGVAIAGLLILTSTQHLWSFLLGTSCLGFSWAFCLPYIQGLLASLDPNGSAVAAGSSTATIGGAAGPALAALIVVDGNYQRVLIFAIALFLVAFVCFFLAGRRAPESGSECDHGTSTV
jgi:predicted MFS family arabinose efflux permease